MDDLFEIKALFGKAAGRVGPAQFFPVVVKAVYEDYTCAVEFSTGAICPDARLKSVVKDGDCFVMVPKLDSIVLVASLENSEEFVILAVDEPSAIIGKWGTLEYELNENGLRLQEGNDTLLSGLTKLVEAVQQVMVMYGNNPDFVKLAEAKAIFDKLMW